MTIEKSIENGIIKQTLKLCDVCGGTGVNPTDKSYTCGRCKGMRIVNHIRIELDTEVPYITEADRIENEEQMCINIRNILEDM